MALVIEDCGAYSKAVIEGEVDFLACHHVNPQRYPFLLESHRYINEHSRYDFLFAFPGKQITANTANKNDFFDRLDAEYKSQQIENYKNEELPFTGGWFLFLSYELVSYIEQKLAHVCAYPHLPLATATRIPVAIIKDHKTQITWLICEKGSEGLLKLVEEDVNKSKEGALYKRVNLTPKSSDSSVFTNGVKRIGEYLKDGDTFQVNLSREWTAEWHDNTNYLDVYHALKLNNPSPFAGLACINGTYICSTSPERLVKTLGDSIEMRPIAGTCRRSESVEGDRALANELLNSDKEQAEHIMLLDLIRNDLGRICKAGSITVDEKMILETYATVHHIVSSVSGHIEQGKIMPSDIIKAVFPGGTITGCPKVRCMEIIDELETKPRGAYTGSMGYLNYNGDMDLNILIRSLVIKDKKLTFRAGAGIVADSVAELELKETVHKATGILKALG